MLCIKSLLFIFKLMLAIGKGFSPKTLLNDAFFQASEVVTAGKNAVWMWKKLCRHVSGNSSADEFYLCLEPTLQGDIANAVPMEFHH